MIASKYSKILGMFSRPSIIIPLLLFLIGISYANTLYSPFVLDDIHSFIEEPNVYVRDFSYDSFSKLSSTFFGKARLIPIATFSINHAMAKGWMPIYHVTNIVIHLLATLAVFWFISTLLRTPVGKLALRGIPPIYFAFFAAALWALNPVQTNAVTYIVQRMTSISALFYVAAVTFYVKGRLASNLKHSLVFYLFCAAMAVGAFLSKENSFMLPAAILLVEWIFITPDLFMRILQRMKWYHWIVLLILVLLILPLFEHRWRSILNTENYRPFTWEERLLTQARVVVHYITLLILPLPGRLNFDYDFPISNSFISPISTLFSMILLGLLFFLAYRKRLTYSLVAFGIFWFFLNLLIESTVIPLEMVFEHRLYLPSIGFYIACLAVMDLLVAFLKTRRLAFEVEQLFILMMVIVVSLFSIGTSVRNHVWRDSYALYEDSAQKSPNKPRTHLNFGVAMGRDRNLERESIKEFEKVIELGKPKKERYIQAVNNIVVAHAKLGEYEEVITRGEKYLEEAPDYIFGGGYPKLMSNLAFAYNKTGRYTDAMQALASGMTKEQGRMNGYLVNAMTATLSEAYEHEEFLEKLDLTTENGNKKLAVRLRMTRLLADLRDYEKANDFLGPILEIYPDHESAKQLNLKIQDQLRKNKKQEELMDISNHSPYNDSLVFKTAFELSDFILKRYSPLIPVVGYLLDRAEEASRPDDPFVLWYRIKLYMETGDAEKLAPELEEAVAAQPDFVPLLRLAGDYYEMIGMQDKAIETFEHILDLYPAEPAWLKYEKRIIDYNEKISMQ